LLLSKFLPSTVEVRVECAEDIWPIEGNDTDLQTVFMNLAGNARDAMPGGGRLLIEANNVRLENRAEKDFVLVSVKDSGAGISPEVLSHIFEPFFTTKRKGEGTGLGLAMVFQIIHNHGGWIDVSSVPSQGTEFQIYLPARPSAKLTTLSGDAPGIPPALFARKGETVLFADDEETLRKMGAIFLERLGYGVLLAQDGAEAVDLYRRHLATVTVVVLDMTMPKLTGKECMRRILEINPAARIVAASGFSVEGTGDELMQMGAGEFIKKPYTVLALARALKKVLASSGAR
jgi:two-component system cell cycle sensor histidine kinase/response regulator CckA